MATGDVNVTKYTKTPDGKTVYLVRYRRQTRRVELFPADADTIKAKISELCNIPAEELAGVTIS